ncbi:hypothetical protein CNR27_08915 [Luteimonas chenhongjianii]|uniref:DUF4142 domain-containing protein n=1 Tax=Luteimonas chenhongjianii TaxID=2006110 RepID=A0A290XEP1_9GAMM|nr:DUF4142 domain-containing protein [Luteimonas chenhongjianii]ATD67541.1 hypothetical protein CNR27_08915 [Luteimonas chenhongjianii]
MNIAPTLLAAALALVLSACDDKKNDRSADSTAGTGTSAAGSTTAGSGATAPPTDTSNTAANTAADAGTATTGASTTADATHDATAAAHGTLSESDRKALREVAEIDRHEIAAAKHALNKKNMKEAVRSYAETLLADHTRDLEATERLLGGSTDGKTSSSRRALGMTSTGSTGAAGTADAATDNDSDLHRMREKFDEDVRRLDALADDAYAKAWVDHMIRSHEDALTKLDRDIPKATDPAVKAQLEQTRAMIARHLEMARSLKASHDA